MDNNTPIWQLTVGEFTTLVNQLLSQNNQSTTDVPVKRYEYGLDGLAKVLGCGKTRACQLKNSGKLRGISQLGRTIVVDVEECIKSFNHE